MPLKMVLMVGVAEKVAEEQFNAVTEAEVSVTSSSWQEKKSPDANT